MAITNEFDILKEISKFMGVPESNLPKKNDSLTDAIAAEAVRLSLFQFPESKSILTPIHVLQVKNWALRKSRSFLEYFGLNPKDKIDDIVDNDNGYDMAFLGDMIKLSRGYVVPAPSRFISIDSGQILLISGLPTLALAEKGLTVIINGISRTLNAVSSKEMNEYSIFELSRDDYLDKSEVEKEPKEFLEFLISKYDKGKWRQNNYETGYLGNMRRYGFLWGSNPVEVKIEGRTLSFWKAQFDYNSIYRLKFKDRDKTEFAVTIPNKYWKRVCLAMDTLFGNKREATIDQKNEVVGLSLDFGPPASEMRQIYALGGLREDRRDGKVSWTFPSRFLDDVLQIAKDLWLKVVKEV